MAKNYGSIYLLFMSMSAYIWEFNGGVWFAKTFPLDMHYFIDFFSLFI